MSAYGACAASPPFFKGGTGVVCNIKSKKICRTYILYAPCMYIFRTIYYKYSTLSLPMLKSRSRMLMLGRKPVLAAYTW